MPNPEQRKNFQDTTETDVSVPAYGVEEYLERAGSFYFRTDQLKKEARYVLLLQDINKHKREGTNWREDLELVREIEKFITETYHERIREKQAQGDERAVQYFQERLRILLEDLHRKG